MNIDNHECLGSDQGGKSDGRAILVTNGEIGYFHNPSILKGFKNKTRYHTDPVSRLNAFITLR
jgi:hypothetical protein